MRIKTWEDYEFFCKAANEYFDSNKGLTWKQFCEGLKDLEE